MHLLDNNKLWFPPVENAMEDGLLAIGGNLSKERLLLAYRSGIFPWYSGRTPLWWSPPERCVIFPSDIKISKSMQVLLKKNAFHFTIDTAFEQVIHYCKSILREGQDGTWITQEVKQAYIQMHRAGYAHSAEVWIGKELVGGLYGICLGKIFCGESMFSRVTNASKYALINYAAYLQQQGVELIDCQICTSHLQSLGATMIDRNEFISLLKKWT